MARDDDEFNLNLGNLTRSLDNVLGVQGGAARGSDRGF